jgi:hypothetical protein
LNKNSDMALSIYRQVLTISLNKPFSVKLSSACVVFLEMLGFDSNIKI